MWAPYLVQIPMVPQVFRDHQDLSPAGGQNSPINYLLFYQHLHSSGAATKYTIMNNAPARVTHNVKPTWWRCAELAPLFVLFPDWPLFPFSGVEVGASTVVVVTVGIKSTILVDVCPNLSSRPLTIGTTMNVLSQPLMFTSVTSTSYLSFSQQVVAALLLDTSVKKLPTLKPSSARYNLYFVMPSSSIVSLSKFGPHETFPVYKSAAPFESAEWVILQTLHFILGGVPDSVRLASVTVLPAGQVNLKLSAAVRHLLFVACNVGVISAPAFTCPVFVIG